MLPYQQSMKATIIIKSLCSMFLHIGTKQNIFQIEWGMFCPKTTLIEMFHHAVLSIVSPPPIHFVPL